MEVICPFCSGSLDAPDTIADGITLMCPICSSRFEYSKGDVNFSKGGVQKLNCNHRLSFQNLYRLYGRKFATVVALLMGAYICVIMTLMYNELRKVDRRVWTILSDVSSIETDVSSIESDVSSMESDLSHVKNWGVQIER